MKKKLSLIMAAVLTAACVFTGCGKSGEKNESTKESTKTTAESGEASSESTDKSDKKIGVVQMIENGAFNDMRDGIVEQMKANGYTDIEIKCAQGDGSALQTIAQNMSDGSYDVVFTIATPPTQAMVNLESDTPVFFCSVSAPVAAGILTTMEKPDKNATGTSNAIPIADIFALSDKLTPGIEKYGFIYCTSEDNSVNTIKNAKEYCDSNDIAYEEVSVTSSADVEQAVKSLVEKGAKAIFIPNDSVIQSAMSVVTEVARDNKIPVYGSSATMVDSGCFATIAISDVEIGKLTADMALQYLKDGRKVEDIPSIVVPASKTVVNKTTVEALGITIPEGVEVEYVDDAK